MPPELDDRIERIETAIGKMTLAVEQIRQRLEDRWIPVQSFAPEPYEVISPFAAVVRADGEEFEASFFDANIHSSGDTEEEAVRNLKSAILDSLDRLSSLPDDQLGPAMRRQKSVLQSHVRRI